MSVWLCGDFNFNRAEQVWTNNIRLYGEYRDKKNKFEIELQVYGISREKINDYLMDTVAPVLLKNQGDVSSNKALKLELLPAVLLVGNDLYHRNQVIRTLTLANCLLPGAPLLKEAIKKSTFTIKDQQFWEECSKEKWPEEKIEDLGHELRKLLQVPNLLWLLDPVLRSLLAKRNGELLKFLICLEPEALYCPIVGMSLLLRSCYANHLDEIDLILKQAERIKCLEQIYSIKKLLYLGVNSLVLEKLFTHFPGNPFEFTNQWENINPEVNKQAATYVCNKIKEELIKYPAFTYLFKEEHFPDLARFNLPPHDVDELIADLKALLKKPFESDSQKAFTSKDRGVQMRSRQAGYVLASKQMGWSSLINSFLFDQSVSKEFAQLKSDECFISHPNLTYTWLEESVVCSKDKVSTAIKDSAVSLVRTHCHAMLTIQGEGVFYFFDPNIGVYKFVDPQIFASFASECAELWVHFKSGDPDPNFMPLIQKYGAHITGCQYIAMWPELSLEDGICLSFCLNLAEQLLSGIQKGKKINELLNSEELGYQKFTPLHHLQDTVESYLDRSLFSQAVQEWEAFSSLGNIRTYLTFLIAKANDLISQGRPKKAINIFKKAGEIVERISLLEGMPEQTSSKKQILLDQRKKEIEKGLEIARAKESQPKVQRKPRRKNAEPTATTPIEWNTYLTIVTLKLKN